MNKTELYTALRPYTLPDTKKSVIQTCSTLTLYLSSLTLMVLLLKLQASAWLVLILSILTAPVFIKIFIIFHDCCHTSYFKSRRACSLLGTLLGVLIFTAYSDWQRTHGIHHNNVANLEKRGVGDVWLMTIEEYSRAGLWKKIRYRLFRNPLVMLFISPPFLFLILNRFPSRGYGRKQLKSILFTNLMILLMVSGLVLAIGWKGLLLILLPMIFTASLLGVWLFYVQHQFRKVYWAHDEEWDRFRAAMEGCSFYTMPGFLRWCTGNIGYHHIHHLSPRIPNYWLKECYDAIPELQKVKPIPFIGGIRNLLLCLWDEQSGDLVSFREAQKIIPDK